MIKLIKKAFSYLLLPLIRRKDLNPGVTALVCCKEEEYNIELCLNSLKDLVDQIICVDHNSEDSTYDKMLEFKNHHKEKDIIVVKFKGTSLKDARNYGLQYIKHKWLLNCGGDFVFNRESQNVSLFFKRLNSLNKLESYQLTYVNLYGDLHHTYSNSNIITTGENYIVKMTKLIKFYENEKFDYLRIPFFYEKRSISEPFFFHLSGMKDILRLLYRNCYFEWREIVNYLESKNIKNSPYLNFKYFEKYWQFYLYESTCIKSIKYRHSRQICELAIKKYDPEKFIQYPNIIKDLITKGNERFKVLYKNKKPFYRKDMNDKDMLNYQPTKDDLNWSINEFEEKIIKKEYLTNIKNEYK